MIIDDLQKRKKALHLRRFYRSVKIEVIENKEYFGNKKIPVILFLLTILLFVSFFIFSAHKEFALKTGVIVLLFGLFNLYKTFRVPILAINEKGIELRPISISWKNIRKVETGFTNRFYLTVHLRNGKTVKEKLENISIWDYVQAAAQLQGFQKKYRNKFILKK